MLPPDLAFLSNGNMVVVEYSGNRTQILTPDGNPILSITSYMSNPWSVDVDADDRIYVANWGSGTVVVFDALGNFYRQLDKTFGNPRNFRISRKSGNMIVADVSGIHLLNPKGVVQRLFKQPNTNPYGLAFDGNDKIIASDSGAGKFYIYDSAGDPVSSYGDAGKGIGLTNTPRGLIVDSDGKIFCVDADNVIVYQ